MNTCRYFKKSDPQMRQMDDFVIPAEWWSRPYEYAWATQFVNSGDTVLDAGCGVVFPLEGGGTVGYPFKFYLGRRVSTWACDSDPKIMNVQDRGDDYEIQIMNQDFTTEPLDTLVKFDTVFCISVLEHMPRVERIFGLAEFRRILKPGGRLVLTVDVPTVNSAELISDLQRLGFKVADYDLTVPEDAITGYGLMCYRVLAIKG